jgi:hypothetical protein
MAAAAPAEASSGGGGPAITTAKLVGRSPPHWRPSAEEDGSLALPPEQRGKVHRCLADDEGDDGRWMDVPLPGEVLRGAAGLTVAMLECVLLPFPPFHGEQSGPPGARGEGAQKGRQDGSGDAGGSAEEADEGTEMTEKGATAAGGVRVITADDDDGDTAAAAAAAAASKRVPARPPATPTAPADDAAYTPDCITQPPHPGCVPGSPLDTGAKVRVSTRPKPYFRELADDDTGAFPTPGECFGDVRVFTEQAATCMCVRLYALCCAARACVRADVCIC